MEQEIGEQAVRFLRSLEAYDFGGMRSMCTDAATVWHNDGKGEQSIDEKLEQLKPLVANVDSLRYDLVRRFQNSDEVLQQYVLRMTMADGSGTELHAAMYFHFTGGLIDRMEEYAYTVPVEADANADATEGGVLT